jgi:glycerate-2-kinase
MEEGLSMRIKNYEELTNHGNIKGRKIVADIIGAGLDAGNPYNNTRKLMSVKDNKLIFDCEDMEAEEDPRSGPAVYDLSEIDRIFCFAVGKGILYIVKAVEDVLGDRLTGGLAVCKHGDDMITGKVIAISGSHPVPDRAGVEGNRKMMEMIAALDLTEKDLCITAMGNGCSSLACLPADGITVEEVAFMNQLCLIDNGMPTGDCSFLRNQIDLFRGGRILRAMRPARIVNLIGVGPGGSGSDFGGLQSNTRKYASIYEQWQRENLWLPNMADRTTTAQTIEIAKKWRVFDKLPQSIQDKLLSNDPGSDTLGYEEYESYDMRIFGVMPQSMSAFHSAIAKAKELGLNTYILTQGTQCEAAPTGQFVARIALYQSRSPESPFIKPCAIFISGELIVTVNNEKGIGGTNQEFCTAAAVNLDGNKRIVIGAVDTDGTDGPGGDFHPDARVKGIKCLTGGLVDGYTAGEAREKGVDLFTAIKTHGTSTALWELGSGIAAVQDISVGDLHCVLIMDTDG